MRFNRARANDIRFDRVGDRYIIYRYRPSRMPGESQRMWGWVLWMVLVLILVTFLGFAYMAECGATLGAVSLDPVAPTF